jgi:hypothetical protein
MAGQASISTEILARYVADAAREVDGVHGLTDSPLPHRHAVRVTGEDGAVRVELRMADVEPAAAEVVVDAVGPAG